MARIKKLIGFLVAVQMFVWAAQANLNLGTNSLVFGSGAGTSSIVFGATGEWSATTTSDWIHIAPGNEAGSNSGLLQFTYDSNPGATRTGTIQFNDSQATLTVTQAGADYVATSKVTTLLSQVLSSAVIDAGGNVYFADVIAGTIKKWTAATHDVTSLVSTGLKDPNSIAVSNSGDVYIADTGHNAIKKWTAATGQLTGLVFGLNQPRAVAVDSASNVYIADTGNNSVEKWAPVSGQLTTIASSLNKPSGVAVDSNGNVYIGDTGNSVIEKWAADTGQVTMLISSGLNAPYALSLDGAGNLYIADNGTIKEWTAATGQLTTLFSSHIDFEPTGVGSDRAGNLSITWFSMYHGLRVGGAISAPARPPSVDTLNSIYISPSVTSDLAVDALGNLYFNDGDTLGRRVIRKWSAVTGQFMTVESDFNASFNGLALYGAGDLYFTTTLADSPPGSIKKWIASTGQTVHVTNDSSREYPIGLAVNLAGDVYFADSAGTVYPPSTNDAIKKWTASTGQLTTLVPGLTNPDKVAIDAAGNVYFSLVYPSAGAIKEWEASTGAVSTLASATDPPKGSGLDSGVAVDGAGDVYFSSGGAIVKRAAATGQISILSTVILDPDGSFSRDGLLGAAAMKLDSLNNIYALSYGDIKKLTRAFVGPETVVEPLSSGSDQLLPVLPVGTPLDAVSDEPWLTITSQENGVVQFSFTATTTPRTAHISVLGQTIPVTQADTTLPTVISYSVLWGSRRLLRYRAARHPGLARKEESPSRLSLSSPRPPGALRRG